MNIKASYVVIVMVCTEVVNHCVHTFMNTIVNKGHMSAPRGPHDCTVMVMTKGKEIHVQKEG